MELHCVLFLVDAAWPRLGRAFRTAPVSRQTNPNPVWHSPRFHSRPATLLRPPFCPFRQCRLVFSRCRSSGDGMRRRSVLPSDTTLPKEDLLWPEVECGPRWQNCSAATKSQWGR